MKGLFLQGGGAKGAFEAGVIYGLYERGQDFNIISGTSIGAINAYYIYTGNIQELKKTWTNISSSSLNDRVINDITIDNSEFLNALKILEGTNESVKSVFVNYVEIANSKLKEISVDLTTLNKSERLKAIEYSSLLPCKKAKGRKFCDIVNKIDSKTTVDEFKKDLVQGVYDGYKLDGGILNNNFLQPFVANRVDKLFLIVFKKNYEIPDYILNIYNREDIVLIEPKTTFGSKDTLRFEREFCKDLFNEGYEIARKLII